MGIKQANYYVFYNGFFIQEIYINSKGSVFRTYTGDIKESAEFCKRDALMVAGILNELENNMSHFIIKSVFAEQFQKEHVQQVQH